MKLKMAQNSLFAILLRSRWWVSFAAGGAMALVARIVAPAGYEGLALFAAFPFVTIGCIAAWKQLRAPSPARVAQTLQAVGAMPWTEFAAVLEEGFRRQGYEVARLADAAADLQLTQAGRTTLVSAKRWKAARLGIEPLRDLHKVVERREAHGGLCIALGEVSDNARDFAKAQRIELMQGDQLAALLHGVALPRAAR
ncbi:restriction endonuclease [Piscinibacter sp. XHJ-5]|uniref:restriction endonuclease n=1 Tax=Piscinibacter sp. XHJ-5 TaxID=3037797 RepID=UPI002452F4BC|nr:restriction endonuclease [Piscinibacter sp. XHJ-5]